jgi:hypothetical protein
MINVICFKNIYFLRKKPELAFYSDKLKLILAGKFVQGTDYFFLAVPPPARLTVPPFLRFATPPFLATKLTGVRTPLVGRTGNP